MVANRRITILISLILLLLPVLCSSSYAPAGAQAISYHLEHQYSKLWVNQDGSIDLLYDIDIACDGGQISKVFVGQPRNEFTLGEAFDERGNALQISKDFEQGPSVQVLFRSPIVAGSHLRFNLTTNVQKMVYLDNTNPGNVGLQFIPTWWDGTVKELRVLIVLPEGAVLSMVRNTPDWDNNFPDPETGRLTLYWQRFNLATGQKFTVGVSFPKDLVQHYEVQRTGIESFIYDFLLPNLPTFLAFGVLVAVVGLVIRRINRRQQYEKPVMRIESLGVRRGLTAVEAAWLLGLGPVKTVVAMLYGLLQKRAVWVKESEPKLMLDVMPEFRDAKGRSGSPLRYYEYRFIDAIRGDGTLEENGLAQAVIMVRDTVEEKMRGYNRQENVKYYGGIVEQAWKQVEGAGTPELASQAFDENLLWLYLDDRFGDRLKDTLGNRVFIPDPAWWWYWWWARPGPAPPLPGPVGGETPKPQPLPGAEVADKIATSLEKSANGLVTNLEKFADAVAPARAELSRAPARRGSGGFCACASCACACACVSCACACAGGRVG